MRIGIDLGGMSIKAGLVDDAYRIQYKDSAVTETNQGADKIIGDMIKLIGRIRAANPDVPVECIGIGVPGHVDKKTKLVVICNNIPVSNVDVRGRIESATGIPTFIDNDANVAAFGEVIAGAAKDYRDAVMITLGTGVGAGIVINNQIYSGCNGAAGELGHMVIEYDGLPCNCGRRGCLELYASASALVRLTREAMDAHPESLMWQLCENDAAKASGKTSFDAMRKGDAVAKQVIDDYVRYLAVGVVDVIDMFQPEAIIIGGGISKEGDFLLKPLKEIVKRERYSKGEDQTKLVIAQLGNDAGIIGAAFLGYEKTID